jgi:hypothetical protein
MTRGSASLARRTRARIDAGVAFVPQPPPREPWVAPTTLHGRIVLRLADGPMLATELAAARGVAVEEIDGVADRLRVDCEALVRWGGSAVGAAVGGELWGCEGVGNETDGEEGGVMINSEHYLSRRRTWQLW